MIFTWQSLRASLLDQGTPAFSFACGGEVMPDPAPGEAVVRHRGVRASAEIIRHSGFDGVEWRPVLENESGQDSPIISHIYALDVQFEKPETGIPHAWYSNGARPRDGHLLLDQPLGWLANLRLQNGFGGGKALDQIPFVNLDFGGRGLIVAVGWPGRWFIELSRDRTRKTSLRVGLEKAELSLHPGERITAPRVLVMFWEGDRTAAHNRWRQHILVHHGPRIDGQPVRHLTSLLTWGGMKTRNHLALIETVRQQRLPYDVYWIDAGWYGPSHETEEYQDLKTEDWFFHVGDWRVNPLVHPDGLKPVSEAAHAAGMRFLLWFEPERAVIDSPLVHEHPEWFFAGTSESFVAGRTCVWRAFNFGIPEARRWMTDWISNRIHELSIDIFRQDYNVPPGESWDRTDTPGRIGLSEIRQVEGLLAFWDELRRRFPHLVLDIVQRGDLDSIARGLDLTRSDDEFSPNADAMTSQNALAGLAPWSPLSGTGPCPRLGMTDYEAFSTLSASLAMPIFRSGSDVPVQPTPPADYPWEWLRMVLETQRRARPFLIGDFYPLLRGTLSSENWCASQYHRPDQDAGLVLAFRREHSPYVAADLVLHGLDPQGRYAFADHLGRPIAEYAGKDLGTTGLPVTCAKSGVVLCFYRRVP